MKQIRGSLTLAYTQVPIQYIDATLAISDDHISFSKQPAQLRETWLNSATTSDEFRTNLTWLQKHSCLNINTC